MTPNLRSSLTRNRRFLLPAVAILVVWAAAAFLLTVSNRNASAELEDLIAQAMEARRLAGAIQALEQATPGGTAASSLSLMTLTEQGAKRYGLDGALKQMDPEDDRHLRLRLRDARFDDMMLWWGQLHAESSVSVVQARISAGSAPGLVDAEATLSR